MSDSTPQPARRCPRCGAEMSPDVAAGLCPACLLAVALEPASDFDSQAVTVLPSTSASGPTRSADARLAPEQAFGPYRIVRLLGRGGMGEVYEVEHVEQGRRLALKVLSQRLTDPRDRARFLREGQLAASITHPNVVYIFGSEEIAGTPVIAMELLAGGTLKDRVREQGSLPPADAVDAILQIIAGLDAAQAGGILHRDIKPANCFTDRDGTVKVGDFGLSISTMARDVSQLTTTGTFQGTPQFAAPEQLKGEPLDVRADIYAVAATLYYLLTGQPPFDDKDLMALLTRIATEVPRPPREVQARVPRGLATVVLRCLAKDRVGRFATYAALHEALRPFGSTAPAADAPLGSRLAAGVIDFVILRLFVSVINDLLGVTWSFLSTTLFMGTYFALSEGFSGASVGKSIFGLRVTDVEGGRPGLVRASVRSALFVLAARAHALIPNSLLIRAFIPAGGFDPGTFGGFLLFVSVLRPLAPLALFLTARPRHGFAGLHELISGTRVTTASREARAGGSWNVLSDKFSMDQTRADAPGLATRGPFVLLESPSSTASARLSLAFDPALRRQVWIREAPAGTPLSAAARRDLARPGRLRWLAGQQSPSGTWEAFEAPRGASLLSLAATKQPWRAVRQWLADLAEELTLCERDGNVPALGLDRVWITTEGRAKLLDFAPPGTTPRDTAANIDNADDARRPETLLGSVAWTALSGREQRASDALPITRPPLPLSGTAVLHALRTPRAERLDDVLDLCRLALQTPSDVTRRSRALLPALMAAVLCVIGISISVVSDRVRGPAGVGTDEQALFNSLVTIDLLRQSGATESDPERRALEIYIAARYAPLSARPSSFLGALRPFRQLANEIAARYPTVSDAELRVALERLGRDRLDRLNRIEASKSESAYVTVLTLLANIGGIGYLALLFAFVFRGGLSLRLFRLALVDDAGAEVSRWRALWRAALAWMPLIGLQLLVDDASMSHGVHATAAWASAGALGLIIAVGMCWALVDPARGLHDRLAGTWLVPR